MRIVIAGGHGQIALHLGRLLAARGDEPVGIIRNPAQADDLHAAGITPAVLDLEATTVDVLAERLVGADAVVFAAGAGPGSGVARKDTVDRAAAVLLADACVPAEVGRYLLVSSVGVESVRGGGTPTGVDATFVAYLRAKLAAEDDLRARDLAWTVLRPGRLTDAPPRGRVLLAPAVPAGAISRGDVAAVVMALLDAPSSARQVLELIEGDVPIEEAVRAL